MRPKFCPACGRETKKLFGNKCEMCMKKQSFAHVPEKIKISVCSSCGRVCGSDQKRIDSKLLEKIVAGKLKVNGTIREVSVKMEGDTAEILVTGLLNGKIKVKEKLETRLQIRKRLCENCGKVRGGYYEAVIQLRTQDKNKLENALAITESLVNKRGKVTKIEHRKEGVDLYFTPKKAMGNIVKNIPGKKEVKKSYTLVTKKDGKDLYRNTVLVRL